MSVVNWFMKSVIRKPDIVDTSEADRKLAEVTQVTLRENERARELLLVYENRPLRSRDPITARVRGDHS